MVYFQIVRYNFKIISSVINRFSKIDKYGVLNVYHPSNILLPNRTPGFWVVHDELESLEKTSYYRYGKI